MYKCNLKVCGRVYTYTERVLNAKLCFVGIIYKGTSTKKNNFLKKMQKKC